METQLPFTVLMADDDPDDRILAREAFEENMIRCNLQFVEDGEQLFDYLFTRGKFTGKELPRPDLILLDLNMPRKDGREVLKELKEHSDFKRIPVVVLTTSKAEEDVLRTYDLGVNSFITKPVTFEELVEVIKQISTYWFETVELPC